MPASQPHARDGSTRPVQKTSGMSIMCFTGNVGAHKARFTGNGARSDASFTGYPRAKALTSRSSEHVGKAADSIGHALCDDEVQQVTASSLLAWFNRGSLLRKGFRFHVNLACGVTVSGLSRPLPRWPRCAAYRQHQFMMRLQCFGTT